MSDELYRQKCTACRRDSPHVTQDEVARFKPEIPDWELIEDAGIPKLDRDYKFRNFQQALDFTAAIGEMAESEGHHPKLVTEWGRVGVTWWTHKIRNLHQNDFIMAAKTDQVYQRHQEDSVPA